LLNKNLKQNLINKFKNLKDYRLNILEMLISIKYFILLTLNLVNYIIHNQNPLICRKNTHEIPANHVRELLKNTPRN
jgi:hypothetical protein